jgi:hypothetical protein
MTSKQKLLPFEICLEIFQHLDSKSDIYNYIIVCKYWHEAAIQDYYNNRNLLNTPAMLDFLKSKLVLDDKHQHQQFSNERWVKKLIFVNDSATYKNK